MQIISYISIILKHIQINSQFRKDIDAESPVIIFFFFFGGGGDNLQKIIVFHEMKSL